MPTPNIQNLIDTGLLLTRAQQTELHDNIERYSAIERERSLGFSGSSRYELDKWRTPLVSEGMQLLNTRIELSRQNANILTDKTIALLKDKDVWALVSSRAIGIDEIEGLTKSQIVTLKNPAIKKLLDIIEVKFNPLEQASWDFASSHHSISEQYSKSQTTIAKSFSPRISIDCARGLTPSQLEVITDPQLSPLIRPLANTTTPHLISAEELITLPPDKIAILRMPEIQAAVEDRNDGGLGHHVSEVLELSLNEAQKLYKNPAVLELMGTRAFTLKESPVLTLSQAKQLSDQEIHVIEDKTVRGLLQRDNIKLQDISQWGDKEITAIHIASKAIMEGRLSIGQAVEMADTPDRLSIRCILQKNRTPFPPELNRMLAEINSLTDEQAKILAEAPAVLNIVNDSRAGGAPITLQDISQLTPDAVRLVQNNKTMATFIKQSVLSVAEINAISAQAESEYKPALYTLSDPWISQPAAAALIHSERLFLDKAFKLLGQQSMRELLHTPVVTDTLLHNSHLIAQLCTLTPENLEKLEQKISSDPACSIGRESAPDKISRLINDAVDTQTSTLPPQNRFGGGPDNIDPRNPRRQQPKPLSPEEEAFRPTPSIPKMGTFQPGKGKTGGGGQKLP